MINWSTKLVEAFEIDAYDTTRCEYGSEDIITHVKYRGKSRHGPPISKVISKAQIQTDEAIAVRNAMMLERDPDVDRDGIKTTGEENWPTIHKDKCKIIFNPQGRTLFDHKTMRYLGAPGKILLIIVDRNRGLRSAADADKKPDVEIWDDRP